MWKYASYLQKGISHIQNATNCQDSVLIQENDHCVVAALADGLGSLKYSEIAAQTVTKTVCELFLDSELPKTVFETEEQKDSFKNEFIGVLKQQIIDVAKEMNVSAEDMDCTLVFVCISKDYNYAIVGRLGDSAICIIKESGSLAINDSNKSANGTNAILDSDSNERLELYTYNIDTEDVCGFILTSDGLDNELYMKGSSHVNKAAEVYFNAVSTTPNPQIIIAEAVGKLTQDEDSPFDDDISVAVISRLDKPIVLNADPTWLCSCGARNRMQDTYCQSCRKDFAVLYQNIRFRDYGGKSAFFAKINATPDKEMQIVGLSKKAAKPIEAQPKKTAPVPPIKNNQTDLRTPPTTREMPEQAIPQAETNHSATRPLSGKRDAVADYSQVDQRGTPPVQSGSPGKLKGKNSSVPPESTHSNTYGFGTENSTTPQRKAGAHTVPNTKNVPKRQKSNMWPLIAVAIAIFSVGVIAGSFFTKIGISKSINELGERIDAMSNILENMDTTSSTAPVQPDNSSDDNTSPETTLPDDFTVLENGSYYWGEIKNGVPNGYGTLLENGKYYIGKFKNGIKNGSFSIVDQSNPQNVKYVKYENGKEVADEDTNHNTEKVTIAYSIVNIRKEPGAENELLGTLNKGDVVTKLPEESKKVDRDEWIKIETESGIVGWIILSAVEN